MSYFNIENSDFQAKEHGFIELERACLDHMVSHGIPFDGPIYVDGAIHRFSSDSNKKKKDEWYVAHSWVFQGRDYFAATYGSWSNPEAKYSFKSWKDNEQSFLSAGENEALYRYQKEMELRAEEERLKRQEEASIEAQEIWRNASRTPVSDAHRAYLELKKIEGYNVRFGKNSNGYDAMIIPLWNIQGQIRSLQFISVRLPDKKVFKSFLSGGEKKGCFFVIGSLKATDSFYVSEGYATGASVHQAIALPVVVAFDCGNINAVLAALRTKYRHHQIVIAGDDDVETNDNPGRTKSEAAAKSHVCHAVFPKFPETLRLSNGTRPTDFNDLLVLAGIDEVKKQLLDIDRTDKTHCVSSDGWGDPIEFKDDLLPVPNFNPALLPTHLRCYAEDVADRMQCPIDFVAAPQIVMFSSLIGAGCAIRPKQYDNWTVVPNLWGGVVGPPGGMKSPALSESMIPIGHLEKEADEKYQDDCIAEKIELLEIALKKEELTNNLKKAVKSQNTSEIEYNKAALVQLEKEVKRVVWKRYKTNDATIEKLSEILKDNPRGILVYRDELIGFLVSLDKDGREGDRAFYLEGWNGHSSSSVKSDRIGRGTISCNSCISVLGGIQPSKLRQYLFDAVNDIANDGLLQRFQVLVYPDKPKTYKHIDRKPSIKAREKVIEIAHSIAHGDFISMGARIEENFPLAILRFDAEAQEFFNIWLTNLKRRLLDDGDEGIFIEHLSKYPKLMPSLALSSYLIRVASGDPPGSVSLEDAMRAADLCAYLEAHAKRIYSIVDHRSILRAKALLKKLREGALPDGFTYRDVYRKEWRGLANLGEAAEACKELIERGWLKEEKISTTPQGGAPTTRHLIHPILLKKSTSSTDKTDGTDLE